MQLACSSLAHFSMNSCVRLGDTLNVATPVIAQSALSLSFPVQPAPPTWSTTLPQVLTDLVVLVDCFFNSLVVRVPCSLIFWHFWLYIDFWLVVILLLVVRGSKRFLPMPPSWPELYKGSSRWIN